MLHLFSPLKKKKGGGVPCNGEDSPWNTYHAPMPPPPKKMYPYLIIFVCYFVFRTDKYLNIILRCIRNYTLVSRVDTSTQCGAIRWELFENGHFSRGYNFCTNDLILILKTPTRPYSCLAKVIRFSVLVLTCGS